MRTYEFINGITKENGKNFYHISICHITCSEPKTVWFGNAPEEVTEYYRVHYSWKNARRSMSNLTLKVTRTLEESLKLVEKKIKDLEAKIN